MNKINVLITSPSININDNVSGISILTNISIKYNNFVNYYLFKAGRKDKTKLNVLWLLYQPIVLLKFLLKLTTNKIDIVHISMPLERLAIVREFCFIFIANIFKKSIIVHIQGGEYNLVKNVPTLIKHLIEYSFNKASKIIVLGDKELSFLIEEYSISKSKVVIIPNSVKIPSEYKKMDFTKNKQFNILFLGRLDKNKGLMEIVKSLNLLPEINFMFKIAGEGPDKEWFLNACETHIPNRYKYIGVISGSEKGKLLSNCHVFLLPSYYEGLPNALLEAMSYGLVAIVTNVGSIPNVISNNINGIIIPLKDHIKICEALKQLYKDPKFYNKISKKAYQTIYNNYSLDNYLISINKLYKEIINII